MFTTERLTYLPGDRLYLYTDGFEDQFGGPAGRKYMSAPFRTLLIQTAGGPLDHQGHRLEGIFERWRGQQYPQTDDITVMGVKL